MSPTPPTAGAARRSWRRRLGGRYGRHLTTNSSGLWRATRCFDRRSYTTRAGRRIEPRVRACSETLRPDRTRVRRRRPPRRARRPASRPPAGRLDRPPAAEGWRPTDTERSRPAAGADRANSPASPPEKQDFMVEVLGHALAEMQDKQRETYKRALASGRCNVPRSANCARRWPSSRCCSTANAGDHREQNDQLRHRGVRSIDGARPPRTAKNSELSVALENLSATVAYVKAMGHKRCAAAQQVAPSHPSGAIAVALRRRPTGLQILKTDGGRHRGRRAEEKESQNCRALRA